MRDDRAYQNHIELRTGRPPGRQGDAANRGTTAGHVISELVRKALMPSEKVEVRNGIHMMPRAPEGEPLHTLEDVNRLRDE
jgi:hypothetical protein